MTIGVDVTVEVELDMTLVKVAISLLDMTIGDDIDHGRSNTWSRRITSRRDTT